VRSVSITKQQESNACIFPSFELTARRSVLNDANAPCLKRFRSNWYSGESVTNDSPTGKQQDSIFSLQESCKVTIRGSSVCCVSTEVDQ
jgi:hypothetical protein